MKIITNKTTADGIRVTTTEVWETPAFRDSAFSRLMGLVPTAVMLVGLVSVWASV